MSQWLTWEQINPSRFTYYTDQVGNSVVSACVLISYRTAKPDLFSDRFSGRIIAKMPFVYPAARGIDVKEEA
jgi:hypothetical protein